MAKSKIGKQMARMMSDRAPGGGLKRKEYLSDAAEMKAETFDDARKPKAKYDRQAKNLRKAKDRLNTGKKLMGKDRKRLAGAAEEFTEIKSDHDEDKVDRDETTFIKNTMQSKRGKKKGKK